MAVAVAAAVAAAVAVAVVVVVAVAVAVAVVVAVAVAVVVAVASCGCYCGCGKSATLDIPRSRKYVFSQLLDMLRFRAIFYFPFYAEHILRSRWAKSSFTITFERASNAYFKEILCWKKSIT